MSRASPVCLSGCYRRFLDYVTFKRLSWNWNSPTYLTTQLQLQGNKDIKAYCVAGYMKVYYMLFTVKLRHYFRQWLGNGFVVYANEPHTTYYNCPSKRNTNNCTKVQKFPLELHFKVHSSVQYYFF